MIPSGEEVANARTVNLHTEEADNLKEEHNMLDNEIINKWIVSWRVLN